MPSCSRCGVSQPAPAGARLAQISGSVPGNWCIQTAMAFPWGSIATLGSADWPGLLSSCCASADQAASAVVKVSDGPPATCTVHGANGGRRVPGVTCTVVPAVTCAGTDWPAHERVTVSAATACDSVSSGRTLRSTPVAPSAGALLRRVMG